MRKKFGKQELVRIIEGLKEYPAVLRPAPEGGFDVIFTNLPGARSYGVLRRSAIRAGEELLTAEIFSCLMRGETPPRASDPARLHADEDDPPGTELVMLRVDKGILYRRLGLKRRPRGEALKALGLYGKKPAPPRR